MATSTRRSVQLMEGSINVRMEVSDMFTEFTQSVQQRFQSASFAGVMQTAEEIRGKVIGYTPVLTGAAAVSWEIEFGSRSLSQREFGKRFGTKLPPLVNNGDPLSAVPFSGKMSAGAMPGMHIGGTAVYSASVVSRANNPRSVALRPGSAKTPAGAYYVGYLEHGWTMRNGKPRLGLHMLRRSVDETGVRTLERYIIRAWHSGGGDLSRQVYNLATTAEA